MLLAVAGLVAAPASAGGAAPAADCQPFAAAPCLLPFPNNLFTKPRQPRPHRPARAPARRPRCRPTSRARRSASHQYDRNDGFSPGSAIIVHVPGLDNAAAFARTGAVGARRTWRAAFAKSQPIVLIDEATGQRQLIWSELDVERDRRAPTPTS